MSGAGPAEAQRLFDRFRLEVQNDADWDSEFTPSTYSPGQKLRDLVDGAGAAAVPLLLDALIAGGKLRFWACVGLEWLGPAAGDAAVAVLVEHLSDRREPLAAAAVALDAIAPARARELGVHRWPETMGPVIDRYVRLGVEATVEYVEWFVATQADEDVARFLDRRWPDTPARLADLLRALLHGDRGAAVARAAAEILAFSAVDGVTEELIDALSHGGPLPERVVERVAAHPASERLVPRLVEQSGPANGLTCLITRRRCAGLGTDPAPLRAFLRACLDEPLGVWPGRRHGGAAVTAIAELRDETMLVHLLPLFHADRPAPPGEWDALIRAFASFGDHGRTTLEQHRQRHPDIERLRWALDEVDRYRAYDRRLQDADNAFLRGRVEPAVRGAFAGYGDVLLLQPSAHAAFQLAWIDRAFGVPVTAERVDWIRALGFADEPFLAELVRPVGRPLDGHRSGWDCGESRKDDPARAARAAAVGLPSLATRWHRDDTLEHAANDHIERVRRATTRMVW